MPDGETGDPPGQQAGRTIEVVHSAPKMLNAIRAALIAALSKPDLSATLTQKLSYLINALELIDWVDSVARKHEPDNNGRFVTVSMLQVFYNFVESLGSGSQTLRKLLRVFDELEAGRTHPLVTPERVDNRPRAATSIIAVRGAAAAALQCLMESDVSQKDAAALVARELAKAKVAGLMPKASTVIRWRKHATSKYPDQELAKYFNMTLAMLGKRANPAADSLVVLRILAANAAWGR